MVVWAKIREVFRSIAILLADTFERDYVSKVERRFELTDPAYANRRFDSKLFSIKS
jgi:hypothetical protein